jgi:dihydrofolate reductase
MRRLRYCVAMSLDGFIAGPRGEYDWIARDSGIDFGAIYSRFDTLLMGRGTYEVAKTRGGMLEGTGMRIVVVSTTLDPAQNPGVTIVSANVQEEIGRLKAQPGRDIWLSGGGVLFRSLLNADLVDAVEVSVFPVLLGDGVRLLPGGDRSRLRLERCETLPSGVLMLSYAILNQYGDG